MVKNIFIMAGSSINSTLTQATFYRNGTQTMVNNVFETTGNARFQDLSEGVTLGAATDPVRGWFGDIAEALVFNHQLTPAEMQSVWSYLAAKYGLPQNTVPPPVATAAATR